jgi:hypothetical protein
VPALVGFTGVAQMNVNIVLPVAGVPCPTCVAVTRAACMPGMACVTQVPCVPYISRVPRMADMSAAGKSHGHGYDCEDQPE